MTADSLQDKLQGVFASAGRIEGVRVHLGLGKGPTVYVLSELRASSVEHLIHSPTRFTPSGLSLNWHAGPSGSWELASPCLVQHGTAEATLAATGRKAGWERHANVFECLVPLTCPLGL